MAKLTDRNPDSAPGNWYVARQCSDCGASRTVAPGLVVRLNTTLADRQGFSLDPSVAYVTGFLEFPARWAFEKRSRLRVHEKDPHGSLPAAWSRSELSGGPLYFGAADRRTVDPRASCPAVFRLQALRAAERKE